MLLGSSSSSSSSSSSLPPPVTVEKDLLTSLVASNFENSGVNVNLTLSPPTLPVQKCCMCGATSTPLWRNGPNGPKVLINFSVFSIFVVHIYFSIPLHNFFFIIVGFYFNYPLGFLPFFSFAASKRMYMHLKCI